jgi:hypothetical protein
MICTGNEFRCAEQDEPDRFTAWPQALSGRT